MSACICVCNKRGEEGEEGTGGDRRGEVVERRWRGDGEEPERSRRGGGEEKRDEREDLGVRTTQCLSNIEEERGRNEGSEGSEEDS